MGTLTFAVNKLLTELSAEQLVFELLEELPRKDAVRLINLIAFDHDIDLKWE